MAVTSAMASSPLVLEVLLYASPTTQNYFAKGGIDAKINTVETVVVEAPRKATPAHLSALPPPLPVAPVAPVAAEPVVISLPEAVAELSAKTERAAWETARHAGFDAEHDEALDHATGSDDPRTMAMRLAPTKRDA